MTQPFHALKNLARSGRDVLQSAWLHKHLKKQKTSDTIFILGSGSSLENIKDWSLISRHDSIGFNFFMIHNHVPTYYCIEAPRDPDSRNCMKRLVLFKGDEYWRKTVPLIKPRAGYAELYFLFKELNIPCHVVTSVTINAENCSELIKAIEHHNRHIIYRHLSIMHGQGVASIETISNFCVRLGYKKIVFVGIDLNNTNYFYNEERYLALRNKHLIPSTDQVGAVHKTNDPQQKYGHMIVTDVIRCYSEHYSQEGIEFYVENKDSALADFLPVWSLS